MSNARDLILFARILREIEQGKTPAEIIEALAPLVLGDGETHPPFRISPPEKWAAAGILQAVHFARQITSHYVQIFQDPRLLPVTHSLRQKNIAIKLDQQFKLVLREAARRSGQSLIEEGELVRDDFLDEPILYLKQEARSKSFPKTKNRGVKLSDLEQRFDDKLLVKGIHLQQMVEKDSFQY